MVGDPRDPTAYRIAIASLGLAFVTILAGICWVCAEHWCVRNIPVELWFVAAAVGGVFVGTMLPFSPWQSTYDALSEKREPTWDPSSIVLGLVVAIGCGGAIWLAIAHHDHHHHSLVFYAVATVLGGVLLGLPIPSPARKDR